MTVFRDLFHVTPERAAETMRRHGFTPAAEREQAELQAHKAEAAKREGGPPFVETPDDVKEQHRANLARRLAEAEGGFYGRTFQRGDNA